MKAERIKRNVEKMNFLELEKKVKSLIDEYQVLKRKNIDLESALSQKEGELTESKGRFQELKEEKEAVRDKVDALLLLLQDIPS
jgi:predicted  nucleic acid-binding Zn-ribbon protein